MWFPLHNNYISNELLFNYTKSHSGLTHLLALLEVHVRVCCGVHQTCLSVVQVMTSVYIATWIRFEQIRWRNRGCFGNFSWRNKGDFWWTPGEILCFTYFFPSILKQSWSTFLCPKTALTSLYKYTKSQTPLEKQMSWPFESCAYTPPICTEIILHIVLSALQLKQQIL